MRRVRRRSRGADDVAGTSRAVGIGRVAETRRERGRRAEGVAAAVQNSPVISLSFAKNARLRAELMPQSTGTLW